MDQFDNGRKANLPQNPAEFREGLLKSIDVKLRRLIERASMEELRELQQLFELLEALRKARSN